MSDAPHRDLPFALRFLAGGGKATDFILAKDWSAHRLGDPGGWPEALKAMLSTVLNSPESMILAWGRDELTFFFNETYFPLLGPRLSWAMGAPFREVWSDAWEQAKPIIDDAFAGRSQRFTDLAWRLDTDRGIADTWFSFSYSRILDGNGEVAGLFIFTNETTARVLADRALAASQAELDALNATLERQVAERTAERDGMWNASPDLMLIIDFEGVFRRVNPAWKTLLGYEVEELIGHHVNDFVVVEDTNKTKEAYEAAAHGGIPTVENRYRHKDGSIRWISWTAAPAAGLTYATGRDVTAKKAAEVELGTVQEALRQSQKLEAIGQLTGSVAHDFNNLLTVIKSSTDLLKRTGIAEDRRARYVAAISDTVDRAAKLTSQLLAFARRQALKPEVFAACDSVRSLSVMLETLTGSRVEIATHLPEERCFVKADPSQFDTALVNMAVNARDAMAGEGRLTIHVEAVVSMPAVRTHEAVVGAFVAVSISDTGVGIPNNRLDEIFEPFFTTKSVGHGTGLGLSQVFGFAKQSGGEVTVTSEIGKGSTFTLYLPRVAEVARTPDQGSSDILMDGHGTCVLVVEDNVEVGTFAVQSLTDLGYIPVLASNADEALAELAKDSDRFDVVFSDVVMPGMNGVDLAQEIRRRHHNLPVLLASGYSHVLAQNGTYGFELLHKPYSIEQLSRLLRKVATWQRRKRIMVR